MYGSQSSTQILVQTLIPNDDGMQNPESQSLFSSHGQVKDPGSFSQSPCGGGPSSPVEKSIGISIPVVVPISAPSSGPPVVPGSVVVAATGSSPHPIRAHNTKGKSRFIAAPSSA